MPLSYKLESDTDLSFRINHSDSVFAVASENELPKIRRIIGQCPAVRKVIVLDDVPLQEGEMFIGELRSMGVAYLKEHSAELEARIASIGPDDYANISYTSGTTADPKGILLTHRNYTANVEQGSSVISVPEGSTMLIILPLDHCFAHVAGFYTMMMYGGSIATVPVGKTQLATLRNIPGAIKDTKPYVMLSVPALSRTFKKSIESAVRAQGEKVEKSRVSVLVTVSMAGTLSPPLIITKTEIEEQLRETVPGHAFMYSYQKKAWMDQVIWNLFLKKWEQQLTGQHKILLIVDNATVHSLTITLNHIEVLYLPPNHTSILQPCDQAPIRSFKASYRVKLLEWMVNNKGKKRREMTVPEYIALIIDAYYSIPKSVILAGFRIAGWTDMLPKLREEPSSSSNANDNSEETGDAGCDVELESRAHIEDLTTKMRTLGAKVLDEPEENIEVQIELPDEDPYSVEPFSHRELFTVTEEVVSSLKAAVSTIAKTESEEPDIQKQMIEMAPNLKVARNWVRNRFPLEKQSGLLASLNLMLMTIERDKKKSKKTVQPTLDLFSPKQEE